MIKCNFLFCPTTDWNRPVYIVQDCFQRFIEQRNLNHGSRMAQSTLSENPLFYVVYSFTVSCLSLMIHKV